MRAKENFFRNITFPQRSAAGHRAIIRKGVADMNTRSLEQFQRLLTQSADSEQRFDTYDNPAGASALFSDTTVH